jgi:hypothetical protein
MDLFETIFNEVIEELEKGKNITLPVKAEDEIQTLQEEKPKPYLINNELRIPMNSDPKYHWWNGGQDLEVTLRELNAPEEVIWKYCKRRFE